tara:strand:+ start:51 stop:1376 length:1326 start_codon:yes stop_codon:yes gene_type:complete
MSVSKQGGVLNYLGKQEIVRAPKHWKSSHNSPKTELAYITDAEKGLLLDANLHGSLLNKPNIGPSSLLSFDGWGDVVDGKSDTSASSAGAEGGQGSGGSGNTGYQAESGNKSVVGGKQNTGNAREDYIANYSSKGIVKGGGEKIGYDKDNNPVYADSKVDPAVVQKQKEEYAEQFGGVAPLGSRPVSYSTKYEYNQMKHIADSKLDSIKAKLTQAGHTSFDKDATLSEMKEYVTTLNRTGKIGDSWKNAVDKHGNQLYDDATIAKWEAEGYVPQSVTMQTPGWMGAITGKASPTGTLGAPLTYDQLMNDFDTITKVGQSQGMDWQTRMKTFSPNQWAGSTGQTYDPHTKTFSGGGNEQDAVERITSSYQAGGTAPQESQAAKWYANMGGGQGGFNLTTAYALAKAKQASILGNPSSIRQLAVNQSPYYDFLKLNKLDRGIL